MIKAKVAFLESRFFSS